MSNQHNNMNFMSDQICGNDDITNELLFVGETIFELSPENSIGTLFNIQVKSENHEKAVKKLQEIEWYNKPGKIKFIKKTLTKEDNEKLMFELINLSEKIKKIMMKYGMIPGPDNFRLEKSAFHNISVILSRLKNVNNEYNKHFLQDMVYVDGLKQELLDEALSK